MNKMLAKARYAVFIPAIASILGALLLMFQGSVAMVQTIVDVVTEGTKLKLTIVEILTAVDAILLGTVLLVIGYGLYELFIDEDLDVRAEVAGNLSTPPEVLSVLAASHDDKVRNFAATNPSTPYRALSRIASNEFAGNWARDFGALGHLKTNPMWTHQEILPVAGCAAEPICLLPPSV